MLLRGKVKPLTTAHKPWTILILLPLIHLPSLHQSILASLFLLKQNTSCVVLTQGLCICCFLQREHSSPPLPRYNHSCYLHPLQVSISVSYSQRELQLSILPKGQPNYPLHISYLPSLINFSLWYLFSSKLLFIFLVYCDSHIQNLKSVSTGIFVCYAHCNIPRLFP